MLGVFVHHSHQLLSVIDIAVSNLNGSQFNKISESLGNTVPRADVLLNIF
jgi:hypothetical protein